MYSWTNTSDDYYAHIACQCGRKYRAEEMYICYNCNKILCRFCISVEYEYYGCKNYCKRNQGLSITQARKKKNCCDLCLECPWCFTALVKRCYNNTFMYVCPYCYWDSSNIKFSKPKEADLDILIGQLQETSCSGFLKKMYNFALDKLKEQNSNWVSTSDNLYNPRNVMRGSISTPGGISEMVKKAMEFGTWSIDKLDDTIAKDKEELVQKNIISYDDSYITDSKNSYFAFNFISTLLAGSLDYLDNNFTKIDNIDTLKSKLKNELDFNYISSIEQRWAHSTFQHPIASWQFPKFCDWIPQRAKESKKCKTCKKLIVQAADIIDTKFSTVKLEIAHLFLNQFPYITIYLIDMGLKMVMLKFSILDYKEIKISFKEDTESKIKMVLPPEKYEIGTNKEMAVSEFFFNSSDKFVILNFKFPEEYYSLLTQGSFHVFSFYVVAEYNRGGSETSTVIEYWNEIKFKV